MMDAVIDAVINILILPLMMVLTPIDFLLDKIPGLSEIPQYLASGVDFVSSIPSTIVNLFGISPIIWNSLFMVFVLYLTTSPAINLVKKIWAWIRP